MRIRPSQTAGIVIIAMLASAATTFAQEAAIPTPRTPDLPGIYPGMPMQAAVAQLQKQSSDAYVQTSSTGFSLSKTTSHSADSITASVTNPRNALPAVWIISRSWEDVPSAGGVGVTVSELLAGLHATYGPATMRKTGQNGQNSLYWIFDRNGKMLAHADPALMNCSGSAYAPTVEKGSVRPVTGICATGFFRGDCGFRRLAAGQSDHRGLSCEVGQSALCASRGGEIEDAKNAAAKRARQVQLQKASHNTRTF
jgi:hypothetical protein